jgi:hypothetical protein
LYSLPGGATYRKTLEGAILLLGEVEISMKRRGGEVKERSKN